MSTFIATDGHDDTLWLARNGDPEALVRECDMDPRVWALLRAATYVSDHQVRVHTFSYGGHVTYCSCGHDEDYGEHLKAMFDIDGKGAPDGSH